MAFLHRPKNSGNFEKRDFLVKEGYKHMAYRYHKDGKTIFRAFPTPTEPAGSFEPQVVPVDGEAIEGLSAGSFAFLEIATWIGHKRITYITTCTDVDPTENLSPATALYDTLESFVKEETDKAATGAPVSPALYEWSPWFKFKNKNNIASRPQVRLLLQGVLIEHAGKPCANKKTGVVMPKVPVLYYASKSASDHAEDLLTTKLNAAEDISAENSKMGDILSITGGHAVQEIIYLNEEGKTRYKLEPATDNTGNPLPAVPLDANMVMSYYTPWEELLDLHTAEWHVKKLCEVYSPEAVDFAFRDDPVYGPLVPKNVIGAFDKKYKAAPAQTAAPVQVQMPTAPAAPAQQAPAPTQQATPAPVQMPTIAQPAATATLQAEVIDPNDEIPMEFDKEGKAAEPTKAMSVVEIAMAAAKKGGK